MTEKQDCTHCCHLIEFGTHCAVLSDDFPHQDRCRKFARWWHVGGCGMCRWMRHAKCNHPALKMPTNYHDAREAGQPCGPGAALWERYGLDDWDAEDIAAKLRITS